MTDFRTLCAELHTALEKHDLSLAEYRLFGQSAAALRAALAEPESEGPTDEELSDLWSWSAGQDQGPWPTQQHCFARAVLARWGNHPGSPDSSTLQPVPVSERLPEPTDEPMIPDHYRGDDIRVYREGFHAGYKYAFQLIEKHLDV